MMKNLLSSIHRIGTFDITLASCAWRISGKVGMGGGGDDDDQGM